MSGRNEKEDITKKGNIFRVKPIKCSIQETVADSFAAPNVLTVDVVRTPHIF